MKNILLKSALMSVLGLTMTTASAGETLVYSNEAAKLICKTEATCGTYTAQHPVKVYADGTERRLYWSLNEPEGVDAGVYEARTIGASCQPEDALDHMKATWTLDNQGKPTWAVVTHCDNVTISEFQVYIKLAPPECFFNPRECLINRIDY